MTQPWPGARGCQIKEDETALARCEAPRQSPRHIGRGIIKSVHMLQSEETLNSSSMSVSSALAFEHRRCFFILNQCPAKWLDGHSRTIVDQGTKDSVLCLAFL
jgi:hypothetical protein